MGTGHITVCATPHAGGWHPASWRREGAKGNDIWNPDLWKNVARTAERGLLDAVFFADNGRYEVRISEACSREVHWKAACG